MKLHDFINKYDKPGVVVLLEGKRTVKVEDVEKIEQFGKLMANKTQYILFRSGNASGSDYYFSKGVCSVNRKRLQAITPYNGHRKTENYAYDTISLDEVNVLAEPKLIYQSKKHEATKFIIDKYVSGERDYVSMKAAYIIRDTLKVTGVKGKISPAIFAFFYLDLANPDGGGTGHTKRVCQMNGVPFLSQKVWMEWLNA